MNHISRILSILLHPLIIPTLGLFVIVNLDPFMALMPMIQLQIIFLIVALCTFIIPLTLIPLFLKLGTISSVYMNDRRERILPVFFTGVFYFLAYFTLKRLPFTPRVIEAFMLSSLITVYIAMGITFFWKISMHMIGFGGFAGALLGVSYLHALNLFWPFVVVLVIAGLLGTSRLYLNAHKPAQVYAGFMMSFVFVFIGIFIF